MASFLRNSGPARPTVVSSDGNRPAASSAGAGKTDPREARASVRERVQRRLLSELPPGVTADDPVEVRRVLERVFNEVLAEEDLPLSRIERTQFFEEIAAGILGLGPIEALLRDDTITEILVNGPELVYIERSGLLEETNLRFQDNAEVMRIIDRIVAPIGRRVDESSPMVDARLPDGSRVNVIIPPLSLKGPCISIRKFARTAYDMNDMLKFKSLTPEMIELLKASVVGRMNIVVSGGTSSGKTTLLNILSGYIPNNERIVTIEDSAELRLQQKHVLPLEARPPNVEGKGQVTIRSLVINSLRMRPDRIVVGEVRGGEALDMLQAMNTGHDGSLTTAHSNSPRDTLHRVETMVLMAGMDLPLRAVREQIASAFDLIVHLARMTDGTRKVTNITEVQGMEGDVVVMQDIFKYQQTGFKDGRVEGFFTATGVRPKFLDKLDSAGIYLSPAIFTPNREAKRW